VRWGWVLVVAIAAAVIWSRSRDPAPRSVVVATPVVSATVAVVPPPLVVAEPVTDVGRFADPFCGSPDEPSRFADQKLSAAASRDPRIGAAFGAVEQARASHDLAAERRAWASALRLAPDEPMLALRYALSASASPEFASAAAALENYLAKVPGDIVAARLRSRLEVQVSIQEDFERIDRDSIMLAFPRELDFDATNTLLATLDRSLDDAARLTGSPRRRELYAVVYRDQSELMAVTCMPAWAGGVFDGALRLTMDKIAEKTIRHEIMHAQIGARKVPFWFGEGLAQYFESTEPMQWHSFSSLMLENQAYIPFASLVENFAVFTESHDAALAYTQSEAMLRMLVERDGEGGITRALRLAETGTPPEALARVLGLEEGDLLAFLAREKVRR